jgi:hypothetical protein
MSKSFTSKTPKAQARELHFDIVNNLFELAKRISIVEKFQQETGLQQQSILRQNEMEILANRLSSMQWDVYNLPFIVINEEE